MKEFYNYNNKLADKLFKENKIDNLPANEKKAISTVVENYKFIINNLI